MQHSERIEHFRAFLASPLWHEVIRPQYERWLAQDLEALISAESAEERGKIRFMRRLFHWFYSSGKVSDEDRGRIKRLRQLLAWPQSEVEQSVIDDQREEEIQKSMERASHYAEHGYRSPLPPPE